MPYAILKATDANLRKQITNGLNMATVQITLARNDKLTIPQDNQSLLFGDMTIDGELTIVGELVFL